MRVFLLLILLIFARPVLAEELNSDSGADSSTDTHAAQASDETHPIYAADSHWVASLVIGIAGLFVAAMVIGPIVRSETPEAVPEAVSHEEDPAVDRH